MCGFHSLVGSILEKCGNVWKTAVFPGGYGRIREILHGRMWPDWGLAIG